MFVPSHPFHFHHCLLLIFVKGKCICTNLMTHLLLKSRISPYFEECVWCPKVLHFELFQSMMHIHLLDWRFSGQKEKTFLTMLLHRVYSLKCPFGQILHHKHHFLSLCPTKTFEFWDQKALHHHCHNLQQLLSVRNYVHFQSSQSNNQVLHQSMLDPRKLQEFAVLDPKVSQTHLFLHWRFHMVHIHDLMTLHHQHCLRF